MNTNRLLFNCCMVALLLLCASVSIAYSQPYIYYFETFPGEDTVYDSNIYRPDLQTGNIERFAERQGRVLHILPTSTQEYLFVKRRHQPVSVYYTDSNQSAELEGVDWVHYAIDAPEINRIFLGTGDLERTHHLLVMDRTSFEIIDTLENVGLNYISNYPNDKPFLSKNQSVLFDQVGGSQEGIFLKKINALNLDVISESTQCGEMGPFVMGPGFEDGKSGTAVFGYQYTSGYSDQHYIVCDAESDELGEPLLFPWRSVAYLSPDAEHMIIERVDWTGERGNPEYRPGIVYIFKTSTGKLTQRLQLPPEANSCCLITTRIRFFIMWMKSLPYRLS